MLLNKNKILKAFDNPYKEPWTHYIVDDVLNYDFTNEKEFIFNYSLYFQLLGEFDFIKKDILNVYKPIRLTHNNDGSKRENPIENTWARIRWLANAPKIEQEIHMDHKTKIWTLIIYCYGGTGTYLLDENREFSKEVEWKQNRGVIFSPGNNAFPTWHRVANKGNKIRRVIALNITSDDDKLLDISSAFGDFQKIVNK